MFTLRTPIGQTATAFFKSLQKHGDANFDVVFVNYEVRTYRPSFSLYTSTPTVCTLGNRYWKHEDGILKIKEQMEKNLVKKYEAFYGQAPDLKAGFLSVSTLNEKFIAMKYKKGHVVGNKFNIDFGAHNESIKMEFLAYTTALLEKASSLGAGFCIGRGSL